VVEGQQEGSEPDVSRHDFGIYIVWRARREGSPSLPKTSRINSLGATLISNVRVQRKALCV
jgi:hypothetical protein